MKLLAAALACALTAGCATTDCNSDWYAIGERDGELGVRPQDAYYAERCAGSVDHARYRSGWQAGYELRPLPVW